MCPHGEGLRKRYANSDQRQQPQWQLLLLGETGTSDIGWPGMTSGGQQPACMGAGRCTEADRQMDRLEKTLGRHSSQLHLGWV